MYSVVHFIANQQCPLDFEYLKWVILLQLHIKLSVKSDSLLTILNPQVKLVITIILIISDGNQRSREKLEGQSSSKSCRKGNQVGERNSFENGKFLVLKILRRFKK